VGVGTADAINTFGRGSKDSLNPQWSFLTDAADYPSGHNFGTAPSFTAQYCNGSRIAPEIVSQLCTSTANAPGCIQPGTVGIQVPPGVPDSTYAGPGFSLNPSATVDEGSNWINMLYGPLSMSNATAYKASNTALPPLGNYAPVAGSPAIDAIPTTASTYASAPSTDFFGNPRPDVGRTAIDVGAVEFQGASGTGGGGSGTVSIEPNPLTITLPTGTVSGTGIVTLTNTQPAGGVSVTVTNVAVSSGTGSGLLTWFFNKGPDTCTGVTIAPGATCTVQVRFTNVLAARGVNRPGTITFTDNATGSPQSAALVGHAN
jgi:hypothetical protein